MSDIILTIKGTQLQDGRKEDTEFTTEGRIAIKDGSGVISYGEAGSLDLSEFTEIIAEGDAVIMKKNGTDGMELVFQEGKLYAASYNTPFGPIDVTVLPTFVYVNMDDKNGRIELEYVLDISGVQLVNKLKLSYVSDNIANQA